MKKNSILIDHTTSEPSLAIKIHEYCSLYGIDCLDCPVTGGDIGAKNGTLSILSGGNAEIF
jgi:3-hydroxyisobutyrate dehydrogenase